MHMPQREVLNVLAPVVLDPISVHDWSRSMNDPRLHEELLQARQVAKTCLMDGRRSIEALRPDEASNGSLQEQLQRLVAACKTICPETRITLDLEEARQRGASNRVISEALYIASGTVKNHLSNILGKLGGRDRTQAALEARELGLL